MKYDLRESVLNFTEVFFITQFWLLYSYNAYASAESALVIIIFSSLCFPFFQSHFIACERCRRTLYQMPKCELRQILRQNTCQDCGFNNQKQKSASC